MATEELCVQSAAEKTGEEALSPPHSVLHHLLPFVGCCVVLFWLHRVYMPLILLVTQPAATATGDASAAFFGALNFLGFQRALPLFWESAESFQFSGNPQSFYHFLGTQRATLCLWRSKNCTTFT